MRHTTIRIITTAALLGIAAISVMHKACAGVFDTRDTLGVDLSYTHLMTSNVPSYYGFGNGPPYERYRAEVEVHGSWHGLLFQIEPLMEGGRTIVDGSPTTGGLYACIGTRLWGRLTTSLCHHSAHNLDVSGTHVRAFPGAIEPSVNENYWRISWGAGDRRDFELMGRE
jgi:hypothetical protein